MSLTEPPFFCRELILAISRWLFCSVIMIESYTQANGPGYVCAGLVFSPPDSPIYESLPRDKHTQKKTTLFALDTQFSSCKKPGGDGQIKRPPACRSLAKKLPLPRGIRHSNFCFFLYFFRQAYPPRSLSTVPASAPFSQKDRCMHLGKLGRLWQLIMGSEWGFPPVHSPTTARVLAEGTAWSLFPYSGGELIHNAHGSAPKGPPQANTIQYSPPWVQSHLSSPVSCSFFCQQDPIFFYFRKKGC